MKKMSKESLSTAKHYLFKQGRELEKTLYQFHFENGNNEEVLAALKKFQNADGGFGYGLEADLRSPSSSVLATVHALDIIAELEIKADQLIVQSAVEYLLDQIDADRKLWEMIPKEVNETPHPWWWAYEDLEKNFSGFLVNPRARVLASLWNYPSLMPNGFLESLSQTLLTYLESLPDEMGMYDLQSASMLLETKNLPEKFSKTLLSRLIKNIPLSMVKSIDHIKEHSLTPLFLVSKPEDKLVPEIPSTLLEANLDWIIDAQLEDGSWTLGWDWSEIDADLWAQAEKDWKGNHILNNLKTLKSFGRI